MIYVSHELPVNTESEPALTQADVWDGLVMKANNALPFVPSMTFCEVTARRGDTSFDRDIDFRGQRFTERPPPPPHPPPPSPRAPRLPPAPPAPQTPRTPPAPHPPLRLAPPLPGPPRA